MDGSRTFHAQTQASTCLDLSRVSNSSSLIRLLSLFPLFRLSRWRPWGAPGTRRSLQHVPLGFHLIITFAKYLYSMAALGRLVFISSPLSALSTLVGDPGGRLELPEAVGSTSRLVFILSSLLPNTCLLCTHLSRWRPRGAFGTDSRSCQVSRLVFILSSHTKYLRFMVHVLAGGLGGFSWAVAPAQGNSAGSSPIPRVTKIVLSVPQLLGFRK